MEVSNPNLHNYLSKEFFNLSHMWNNDIINNPKLSNIKFGVQVNPQNAWLVHCYDRCIEKMHDISSIFHHCPELGHCMNHVLMLTVLYLERFPNLFFCLRGVDKAVVALLGASNVPCKMCKNALGKQCHQHYQLQPGREFLTTKSLLLSPWRILVDIAKISPLTTKTFLHELCTDCQFVGEIFLLRYVVWAHGVYTCH